MSSAAKVFIIIGVVSLCQLPFGQFAWGQAHPGGSGKLLSNEEITKLIAKTRDFLKTRDSNSNGKIDPDEADDPQTKLMLDRIFQRIGKEPHYPMAIEEILQDYEASYRSTGSTNSSSVGGASGSSASNPVISGGSSAVGAILTMAPTSGTAALSQASASSPSSPATSSPADAKPAPRKPGRFLTARERLPKGLPDWFLEKDVHGNGQITMAEFTDNWTPDKVAEFARYDLNHDGIITAAECLKVEKAKAGSK